MPMHPVTSTLMYRGMCTIPDILYSAPVNLPEDEVEGENTPALARARARLKVSRGSRQILLLELTHFSTLDSADTGAWTPRLTFKS